MKMFSSTHLDDAGERRELFIVAASAADAIDRIMRMCPDARFISVRPVNPAHRARAARPPLVRGRP